VSTLSVRISYRPVRIGWCVRNDNWDDLRRAVRLTHALWGGRFNPLIPISGLPVSKALVELYGVDALYPISDDNRLREFATGFSGLRWPSSYKDIFIQGARSGAATFLDIYHPVRHLYEQHIKGQPNPTVSVAQFNWDETDPLKDVFLTFYGAYPSKDEIGRDYTEFAGTNLKAQRVQLKPSDIMDPGSLETITPSELTAHMVEWEYVPEKANNGIYFGDASDFEDIVNFWNLRAAGAELVFYDPRYSERMDGLRDTFLKRFPQEIASSANWMRCAAIWSKRATNVDARGFKIPEFLQLSVSEDTWSGRKFKPAPFRLGREFSILGSVSEEAWGSTLSFQLPPKPFFPEPEFHNQEAIVSVYPVGDLYDSESTFRTLPIRGLNEFYGGRMYFRRDKVRIEKHGLAIINSVTTDHMNLRAMPKRELITEMFKTAGIEAEPSQAGRIASRLIRQMGGIQGCRVFKIPGVRDLIESFGPQDDFTRPCAVQKIGRNDPSTGIPNFSEYEYLYLGGPESRRLKPEHAFLFLLKQGIFQVGLSLSCPHCELDPWAPLDGLATDIKCEYCGKDFVITPQLRDRDWRYRRSGLFGKANNQEGSIPVAVTLQQIDTTLSDSGIIATNLNLRPATAAIEPCETDFVVATQELGDGTVSVGIGECKTRAEISDDDVRKLGLVADALDGHGLRSFVFFTKLAPFTPDEIARCRRAQSPDRPRVVMLSDRELEPYFVYERTEREFEFRSTAVSFEDLVAGTQSVYFDPKPKRK